MRQVYMENIQDLLAPHAGEEEASRERLDIKRGPHGLYIPGLTEHQVSLPVPDPNADFEPRGIQAAMLCQDRRLHHRCLTR